ncbi:MAG: hypothetical protein J6J59_08555, partial [Peptococcaceae bacterium]|nr:hypothetical protein [Peptococcaceae bacterium]
LHRIPHNIKPPQAVPIISEIPERGRKKQNILTAYGLLPICCDRSFRKPIINYYGLYTISI